MKRLAIATLLVLQGAVAYAGGFDHAAWDGLLRRHVVPVRQGVATQVDYAGMAADRVRLERYLAATSAVTRAEFERWPKPERLAFLINAYNAWTVERILTGYPGIASIKDLGSFWQSPWKKRFIPLLGETRSLDDIEHGLIRTPGRFDEPRVHFALNCASIGCPALRPEAYTGDRLDAQLEDAARAFLSDRTRNRVEGGAVAVSPIFDWYAEDFERLVPGGVAGFLAHRADALGLTSEQAVALRAGRMPIRHLDYDWRLNRVP